MSIEVTVNRLPSGDSDYLVGLSVYVGSTKFRIVEINEWQWLHFTSPGGIALATCVDTDETYLKVDGLPAYANELSRSGRPAYGSDRYRLRKKPVWVHYEYGEATLCTWRSHGWEHFDACVLASRLVKDYLHDGADQGTTAAMVSLAPV